MECADCHLNGKTRLSEDNVAASWYLDPKNLSLVARLRSAYSLAEANSVHLARGALPQILWLKALGLLSRFNSVELIIIESQKVKRKLQLYVF